MQSEASRTMIIVGGVILCFVVIILVVELVEMLSHPENFSAQVGFVRDNKDFFKSF
jgi:hypothetical protein